MACRIGTRRQSSNILGRRSWESVSKAATCRFGEPADESPIELTRRASHRDIDGGVAVLSFILIAVIGIVAFGFVCPRCRGSLALKAAAILNGSPCLCPKCGVRVDEPAQCRDRLK